MRWGDGAIISARDVMKGGGREDWEKSTASVACFDFVNDILQILEFLFVRTADRTFL